jgi:hypothetical protein
VTRSAVCETMVCGRFRSWQLEKYSEEGQATCPLAVRGTGGVPLAVATVEAYKVCHRHQLDSCQWASGHDGRRLIHPPLGWS